MSSPERFEKRNVLHVRVTCIRLVKPASGTITAETRPARAARNVQPWTGMNTLSVSTLVGKRVRLADGRFGVIERAVHRAGEGGWRGRSSTMVVLVLTVRVGTETLELSAKNVEPVS